MTTQNQVQSLTGATVYDRSGEKIGRIDAVYYDDQTNEPSWITVHTGLFGTHQTFVPLQGVEVNGDQVTVAFDKARVKDAPNIAEDGHLSPEEERQLYRYYGMEYGAAGGGNYDGQAAAQTVGRTSGVTEAGTGTGRPPLTGEGAVGRDTSGPTTDEAMTRSEEQLRVGTQTREAGQARLRKHVATEHQEVTVPVSGLRRARDLGGGARGHAALRAPGG
jgi:stress response protein YsnF